MNPVKVYIASTAAPVAIQRIAREQGIDPGVYINRGTKPSCISDDYYYFVNKGSGVIERRVGFTDFRADLESEISGMSWQLSMALAHCLEQQNQLHNAFDKDATGSSVSTVIWATGTVNSDEEICEIKELLKKLQVSTKLFTQCQLKGIVVYIFFPASQKNEIPESWLLSNGLLENLIKLTPVSTLQDAINELPIEKDVSNESHITADFAKKVEVEKLIHLRKWLAWKNYLVFPALLFLIEVGFEIWAYNNPPPSGNYIAAGVGVISINENANTHKQDINLQPLLHPDRVTLSASYANRGDRCRKNARSEPTNPISKKDLNNFSFPLNKM